MADQQQFLWGYGLSMEDLDSPHLISKEIDVMVRSGANACYVPMSWKRILPEGIGRMDERVAASYEKLFELLRQHALIPVIGLLVDEMPEPLIDRGGWLFGESIYWYSNFIRSVMDHFVDMPVHWTIQWVDETPYPLAFQEEMTELMTKYKGYFPRNQIGCMYSMKHTLSFQWLEAFDYYVIPWVSPEEICQHPRENIMILDGPFLSDDKIHIDGRIHDVMRMDYIRQHVEGLMSCKASGVPIKGYFYHPFVDQMHCESEASRHQGVAYHKASDKSVRLKDSARWLRKREKN